MKQTKLDKTKTYIKIFAMMVLNCHETIKEQEIKDVLQILIIDFKSR